MEKANTLHQGVNDFFRSVHRSGLDPDLVARGFESEAPTSFACLQHAKCAGNDLLIGPAGVVFATGVTANGLDFAGEGGGLFSRSHDARANPATQAPQNSEWVANAL